MPRPWENSYTGGNDGRNKLLDRGLPRVLVPGHHRVAGQVCVGLPPARAPVLDAVGRCKLLPTSTSKPMDRAPYLLCFVSVAMCCMLNTNTNANTNTNINTNTKTITNIPPHRFSGGDNVLAAQVDLQPLLHPLLDRPSRAPGSPFEILPNQKYV